MWRPPVVIWRQLNLGQVARQLIPPQTGKGSRSSTKTRHVQTAKSPVNL